MNLFRSAKREKLSLVFDVGSSSVGGALFSVALDGTPKIVASVREPIILEQDIDSMRFLGLTAKSLNKVAEVLAGKGAPERIFAVLSSPWYVSQTRIIKYKKDEPFTFTGKLAEELIEKDTKLFQEEHFKSDANAENPVRQIELKNIKISLNGYETSSPLNQKASELEMAIFVALSEESVLKKFEETIHKHYNVRKISFATYATSSFTVAREFHKGGNSFLLVDVGGEMTDVAMVKKNILHESISFPLGRNYLIRGAAQALSCTLNEAVSCISLFKDGHAADEARAQIEPVVNQLRSKWLENFQKSLANLSNDISVPATIYLSVDDDLEQFFTDTIKSEQFSQHTLTESKFEIVPLNTEFFHGLVSFESNVARDPFLIVNAIYISRFSNRI